LLLQFEVRYNHPIEGYRRPTPSIPGVSAKEQPMPTDPRKRQKKLERRTAKRQEKKHSLIKKRDAGIAERVADAAKYPVLHSRISEDLWHAGIGHVLLSRELPGGSIAVAMFLVDRYCLGVKDAFAKIVGGFTYESDFMRNSEPRIAWRDVSPATVRKLVEQAVAYAADLGLPPHSDYHKAKPIFGLIDAGESTEAFEFGQDGKPHFVAGPYDSPERCRRIVAILTHRCGPDGFHYTIPLLAAGNSMPPHEIENFPDQLVGPDEEDGLDEPGDGA
jgi:hypothetical protein